MPRVYKEIKPKSLGPLRRAMKRQVPWQMASCELTLPVAGPADSRWPKVAVRKAYQRGLSGASTWYGQAMFWLAEAVRLAVKLLLLLLVIVCCCLCCLLLAQFARAGENDE